MSSDPKTILREIAHGARFEAARFEAALDAMSTEAATLAQKAAFLSLLRGRGETVDEITGAARLLRSRMLRVEAPADAIDIVGTGGDGHGTYNISTAAAFVVAGAGVPVAKHGNRAVSSKSGASDVLAALGVAIDAPPATVSRAIGDAGVGFLWAPLYHPLMKVWAPVRAELGFRTLFNLLGPICNPACVDRQVVGVFSREWVRPVAETLLALGSRHALVVHGSDGMDELTTTGASFVAEVNGGTNGGTNGGRITEYQIVSDDAGLPRATLADLTGGDAAHNAAAMHALLDGAAGPYRDIVVLNAAAALMVAGKAETIAEGARIAARSIDSGAAKAALNRLVAISTAAGSTAAGSAPG
ncbi:MAG: anthranilate phosphoribosyltransferase [Hyphomicrobium aestuarii]|nr:anthranilate phosphoribosyltransferase [Hyphomicrobium aestuarii]